MPGRQENQRDAQHAVRPPSNPSSLAYSVNLDNSCCDVTPRRLCMWQRLCSTPAHQLWCVLPRRTSAAGLLGNQQLTQRLQCL